LVPEPAAAAAEVEIRGRSARSHVCRVRRDPGNRDTRQVLGELLDLALYPDSQNKHSLCYHGLQRGLGLAATDSEASFFVVGLFYTLGVSHRSYEK
jgi:hypothetical protein